MPPLHRFWCKQFERAPGGAGVLNAEEGRHALRVLRLKAGNLVQVFDGAGRQFLAELQGGKPEETRFIVKEELATADSLIQPTLALALSKNEKLDFVVQKATELGVSRIIPFTCERSVRCITDAKRAQNKIVRWQRIALNATKQSGRSRLPQIAPIVDYAAALSMMAPCTPRLFCYEKAKTEVLSQSLRSWLARKKPTPALLIGPEGGFTAQEAEAALVANWRAVSLGANIVRCETAALAALTLLHAAANEI